MILARKISEGYELLAIGMHKFPTHHDIIELQRAFGVILSSLTYKKTIFQNTRIELRAFQEVQRLHQHSSFQTSHSNEQNNTYETSQFGSIKLTSKEQLYIEYTL